MMWWTVWFVCAAVALSGCTAAPAPDPAPDQLPPYYLSPIESPAPDEETQNYLLPALSARYSPGGSWQTAVKPNLYLLTELPRFSSMYAPNLEDGEKRIRPKRKMPSLSINNPMEVLRQRLLLEVARKQLREASQRQAVANRMFLQNVGKRAYWAQTSQEGSHYDN